MAFTLRAMKMCHFAFSSVNNRSVIGEYMAKNTYKSGTFLLAHPVVAASMQMMMMRRRKT